MCLLTKIIAMYHIARTVAYRSILFERARTVPRCPNGKLIIRKSTNKSSSLTEYENDCSLLNAFIQGVDFEILDIFTKHKIHNAHKESIWPLSTTPGTRTDSWIEIKTTVQCVLERSAIVWQVLKGITKVEIQMKDGIKN